jgi:ribosomal protein L40E
LEREKSLALRSIKELEFDRAMGKVSERDFTEMSGRLRARAARIIRQLDAGGTYRERIEKEIASRVGRPANACPSCDAQNDIDARFCKKCGTALGAAS